MEREHAQSIATACNATVCITQTFLCEALICDDKSMARTKRDKDGKDFSPNFTRDFSHQWSSFTLQHYLRHRANWKRLFQLHSVSLFFRILLWGTSYDDVMWENLMTTDFVESPRHRNFFSFATCDCLVNSSGTTVLLYEISPRLASYHVFTSHVER